MKRKHTKLRFLLLDANIVIEAYGLGVWEKLIESVQISVPSIVINDEALFWKSSEGGIPHEINLRRLVREKRIQEVAANEAEIKALGDNFDRAFVDSIHAGEAEALALLYSKRLPGHRFCTSDVPAIIGLVLLGASEAGISLEEVIRSQGIGIKRPLRKQFTDQFFKEQVKLGERKRILGMKLK